MKKNYKLSAKQIRCYGAYLREQERADSTVQKYLHDLAALLAYLRGRALTKAVLLEWKGDLAGRYAPASVIPCWRRSTAFFASWDGEN